MDENKIMSDALKVREALTEKTKLPVAKITLKDSHVTIFSSKVGGKPYLPKGETEPLGANGKPLRLLAQIRCEDIAQMPYYPKTGMLQFFIDGEDDCNGINFDDQTNQNGFCVIYRDTVDETVDENDIPENNLGDDDFFPVYGEYAMEFTFEEQCITTSDYRFDSEFSKLWNEAHPEKEIEQLYDLPDEVCKRFFELEDNNNAHQLGGYPYFTQYDPRETEEKYSRFDWLLFQLDSDSDNGEKIMWGDCGICNFFIALEDLKNQKFDNVLYNWDCF